MRPPTAIRRINRSPSRPLLRGRVVIGINRLPQCQSLSASGCFDCMAEYRRVPRAPSRPTRLVGHCAVGTALERFFAITFSSNAAPPPGWQAPRGSLLPSSHAGPCCQPRFNGGSGKTCSLRRQVQLALQGLRPMTLVSGFRISLAWDVATDCDKISKPVASGGLGPVRRKSLWNFRW